MIRLTVLAAAIVSINASAQIADPALFTALKQRASLGSDVALDAIVRAPETTRLQLVKLNGVNLLEQTTIALPLDAELKLTATRQNVQQTEDGLIIWNGTVDFRNDASESRNPIADAALHEVTLVQNGAMITGNIRVAGQLYALRPLFDGRHAIFAINEDALPKDNCDQIKSSAESKAAVDLPATRAISTARVLIMITQAAKANIPDASAWANLAVTEANKGYERSGVEFRLELAGTYLTSYAETGTFETDLARFRGKTDGFMDNVHTARNDKKADLNYLVTETGDGCGLASDIKAVESTAFATGTRSCSISNFTFQHELGHLQGARHNPEADSTTTPYAFGHGYQDTQKAWRTVMAYNCSPSCPRINYWSNPFNILNGRPMGTSNTHYNAKVLNLTKDSVAAFR